MFLAHKKAGRQAGRHAGRHAVPSRLLFLRLQHAGFMHNQGTPAKLCPPQNPKKLRARECLFRAKVTGLSTLYLTCHVRQGMNAFFFSLGVSAAVAEGVGFPRSTSSLPLHGDHLQTAKQYASHMLIFQGRGRPAGISLPPAAPSPEP